MADTLEAIKAVRAVVERSIGEVKAALEATGGDVEAAIDRLITPQERAANRWAAMLKPVRNKTLDDPAPLPRPDAADERDLPKVLADFEAAARARKFWVGEPDVFAVTQLAARHSLPASYQQFLERFNGADDGIAGRIWAVDSPRSMLDPYDEDGLEGAFPFAEHDGVGYFFIRLEQPGAPIYFYDYSDPPPLTPIARNFESFLRDWLNVDLDLLQVIQDARRRISST